MADGHSGASPARRLRFLPVMPDLIGHLIPVISPDSSSVLSPACSSVISTVVEKSHQTSGTLPSQV